MQSNVYPPQFSTHDDTVQCTHGTVQYTHDNVQCTHVCSCLVLSDLARISGICLKNATEHNAAKLEITRSQVRDQSSKPNLQNGGHFCYR